MEISSKTKNLPFEVQSDKLQGPKESTVSQTSLETLARLFPNTKLSVLQLILQRCGQDLLKAIEYFASESLGMDSNIMPNNHTSAFRSPRLSQTIVDGATSSEQQITDAMLTPIYTSLSRNFYGDGYCLLNIVPEQFSRNIVTTDTANCTGLPLSKNATDQESIAMNLRYNNYFNSGTPQQLRDHMCAQVADRLSTRSSILHLPPILPGISCVQPNCAQCNYKLV